MNAILTTMISLLMCFFMGCFFYALYAVIVLLIAKRKGYPDNEHVWADGNLADYSDDPQ